MKKFVLMLCGLVVASALNAQLSGIKNIPGAGGANDYSTIALAIADLNLQGVGPGGVTFNLAAGHTETFGSPTAGLITATGTASNPIVFQKSGAGANPVITAGIGTSATVDGIIVIAGGDYITFDGISLAENPGNLNATTQMEWGFAMVKARNTFPVDGCQYITIMNCVITLNASNNASSGIYSGNHLATSTANLNFATLGTAGLPDLMNHCRFYSNTISNVTRGFYLTGYNDTSYPPTLYDTYNEIGAAGMGNTISGIGAANNPAHGIYANFQDYLSIAYNTVSGGNTTGAIVGITPRTSGNVNIRYNTITLTMSAGSSGITCIDMYSAGVPGSTVNVDHNQLINCSHLGTGSFSGITWSTGGATRANVFSNTITGNTITTGTMTLIQGGAATLTEINENIIANNTKTGEGSLSCIRINYYNTIIHDNLLYANIINVTGSNTTASTLAGIYNTQNAQTAEQIYNNQIYNLSITGNSLSTNHAVYGISTDIPSNANRELYNNIVKNLAISTPGGSGTVYGIRFNNGGTSNVYKNQVFNLSVPNANGIVYGVTTTGGVQANLFNNFISDLSAPGSSNLNAITGIQVAGGTNAGVYYNTVFLNASSTAATFGTSGLWKSGSTINLTLGNNIIMNNSTPGSSGGYTAAMRWSSTYSHSYYTLASNANNFFAGTPAPNRLIFYDGTNSDLTLADYQVRVAPKDANSFTEDSPLMNKTVAPYDLHMNNLVPTLCESAGIPVTSPSITDDIDGNPRSTSPDVGADEFNGFASGVVNPSGFTATLADSRQINLTLGLNPFANQVTIVWNNTGNFTVPAGTPPPANSPFAGGTVLSSGMSTLVNHTGLTGGMTYYYKAFSYNGTDWSTGVLSQASTILLPPSPLSAFGMASDRVDISWTKNVINNDVIIATNSTATFGQPVNGTAYLAGDLLPGGGTVIYRGPLSSFSHTGLTANTKYYYQAWSYDGYLWYSPTASAANATTLLCAPASALPFTEGFESYTPPAIGCGISLDLNNDGTAWVSNTLNPRTGSKSLTCGSNMLNNDDDWYFIQGLNLTAGTAYQFSFWVRPSNTYPSVAFEVKWGTSPTPGGMYSTPLYVYTMPSVTAYAQVIVTVTPDVTGTYYFGWHSTTLASFGGGNTIIVDDISITSNSCPNPATVSVNNVTTTGADVSWTGGAPNVQIDFGPAGHTPGTGTLINTTVNPYTLTGLSPYTNYSAYVRQDCGLASYSFWTGPANFKTLYQAPVVNTLPASGLTGNGASLNGTIDPSGITTTGYFEYGLTTGYGLIAPGTPSSVAAGSGTTSITATLTGLIANGATYHFRAVGYNNGIYTYGADQTFTTSAAAPTVSTSEATSLSTSGATLNGTVNPNNAPSTVIFEYGTTAAYGSTVTATVSPVAGILTLPSSTPITGLLPYTLYHFRITATNATGTTSGTDKTFTTAELPVVTTLGGTWTPTTATNGTVVFNATVNANTYTSTVTFEYGTTPAFGTSAAGIPGTVTGTETTAITTSPVTLSTTNLNTTIYYRAKAVHSAGTTYGNVQTVTTGIAPLATTNAATMNASGVTIGGSVNANNASTYVSFEYGTTTGYGSTVQFASNPVTGTSASNRTYVFAPGTLAPGTLYNYRVVATNAAGTTLGANQTFTTPVLPTATTTAATLITSTSARLNGTVVANTTTGTNFRFEYGLTPAFGTTGTPTPSSGTSATTVYAPYLNLTGLLPNTTYYYRVYGVNAGGMAYGATMTLTTTAIVPTVTTLTPYGITPTGAILNGTVNANGSITTVTFEYGLTTAYGSVVTASQSPVSGGAATGVNGGINGLLPNTTYHYRVVGVNGAGTSNGSDMTFTTLPLLPTVTTEPATGITPFDALLNGSVNANNASTSVIMEYGLTTAYGSTTVPTPSTITGTVTTDVSTPLSGLAINTTYHYRAVGANAAGITYGADQQFTTSCIEPVISISGPTSVCSGEGAGLIYMTQTGMSNYVWNVSAGGTIVFGQGNSFIIVDWNGTGTQNVTLSYYDEHGCTVATPAVLEVTLYLPFTTGSISADQNIGYNTVPAPLTGIPPTGGTGMYTYQWQSSLNGTDFNDIAGATDLNYAPGALTVTTYYRQIQSSTGNCGNGTTNMVTITVAPPIPANLTLQDITVAPGESNCYNATQTITIAGGGTIFTVQNGGSATMIAGQAIYYLPGTNVGQGGYMHGYIAPTGPWCPQPNPVVNNPQQPDMENQIENIAADHPVRIYPNPTDGHFTVEVNGNTDALLYQVDILSMNGVRLMSVNLNGERKHEVSAHTLRPGIYIIQVTTGSSKSTLKLIKM